MLRRYAKISLCWLQSKREQSAMHTALARAAGILLTINDAAQSRLLMAAAAHQGVVSNAAI
jgi:hypothetical protein